MVGESPVGEVDKRNEHSHASQEVARADERKHTLLQQRYVRHLRGVWVVCG